MSVLFAVLSIIMAYLIGAIPSAWVVVRLVEKYDMRAESDGNISAAAVYRRLGAFPYAVTVLGDIALGALAVLVSLWITRDGATAMLAGLAGMAGHNWSPYLRFKGGQGATSMAGALIAVMPVYLLAGAAVAFIAQRFTKHSGLGTAIGVLFISALAFIFGTALVSDAYPPALLGVYPLALLTMMFIKRTQLHHAEGKPTFSWHK
jgi:acyl phosphate:glycerol-3-phosphate acyltransferase